MKSIQYTSALLQSVAATSNTAGQGKFPSPAFIELAEASRLTDVPEALLLEANRDGQLGLYRDPDGEDPGTYLTPRSLIIYLRDLALEQHRLGLVRLPIDKVTPKAGLQPRTASKKEQVAKMAAKLRAGDYLPPILVRMLEDGNALPLDGHHRRDAHLEAQADFLWVVPSPLPENYDRVLALTMNQDQGENIREGDSRALVVRYFQACPQVYQTHLDGLLTREQIAVELSVSASSVFRAVQQLAGVRPERHDSLMVVTELAAYIERAKPITPQEAEMLLGHIFRACNAAREGIPAVVRKDYRERSKLGVDRMAALLSPALRRLVRRHGGDTTKGKGAK